MKEDWRKEALKNAETKSRKKAVQKIRSKMKRAKTKSSSIYAVSGGLPFTKRSKH